MNPRRSPQPRDSGCGPAPDALPWERRYCPRRDLQCQGKFLRSAAAAFILVPNRSISDLESTGFLAESTGSKIRIQWIPTSDLFNLFHGSSFRNPNPVDSRVEVVDSNFESTG